MKFFKTMGLVVLLALASGAVAASSASASALLVEAPTATVYGQLEGQIKVGLGDGFPAECQVNKLTGSLAGPSTALSASWTSATSCEAPTKQIAVESGGGNNCRLILKPGAQTSEGHFNGLVDIGPSGCSPVKIPRGTTLCEGEFGAQSGLPATFENVGSGTSASVKVHVAGNLAVTCSGSPRSGSIEATWTLSAQSGGKAIGVRVSRAPGLFISGSKAAEEAKGPKVDSEVFSWGATGVGLVQNMNPESAQVIQTKFGKVQCTVTMLGSLSGSASSVTTTPVFSGCSAIGFKATVVAHGCNYVFQVDNAGPPYTGKLSLSCPAGQELEIVASGGLCTLKIPTQLLNNVAYENSGSGENRSILVPPTGQRTIAATGTAGLCSGPAGATNAMPTMFLQGAYL